MPSQECSTVTTTALGQEEEVTVEDMEDILLFVQGAMEAASQVPASSGSVRWCPQPAVFQWTHAVISISSSKDPSPGAVFS